MGDAVKVLLCGDVRGQLKALYKRFDVVRRQAGPLRVWSTCAVESPRAVACAARRGNAVLAACSRHGTWRELSPARPPHCSCVHSHDHTCTGQQGGRPVPGAPVRGRLLRR